MPQSAGKPTIPNVSLRDNLVLLDDGVSIATFNNMPVENIRFENNRELRASQAADQATLEQARSEWLRQSSHNRQRHSR